MLTSGNSGSVGIIKFIKYFTIRKSSTTSEDEETNSLETVISVQEKDTITHACRQRLNSYSKRRTLCSNLPDFLNKKTVIKRSKFRNSAEELKRKNKFQLNLKARVSRWKPDRRSDDIAEERELSYLFISISIIHI